MPRPKKNIAPKATSDIEIKSTTVLTNDSINELNVSKVITKEQIERNALPVLEKSKDAEKQTAPTVMVSWIDANGKRNTYTFTCSEVRINTDKSETLLRSGKKTTLNVNIEAQVLEMDHR